MFVIDVPPQSNMPPPVSRCSAPTSVPRTAAIPLPRAQDQRPPRSSATLIAVAVAGAAGLVLTLWVVVILVRGARHARSDARTPAVGTAPTQLSREEYALQAKREDDAFSNAIAAEDDTSLENYLREFPAGMHRDYASAELAARHERAAWADASARGTLAAFDEYLRTYPDGSHTGEAARARKVLADDQELARAAAQGEGAVNQYIRRHPAGPALDKANNTLATLRLERFDWDKATELDTDAAYRSYLASYANGRHVSDAQSRIAEIAAWPTACITMTTSGEMAKSKDAEPALRTAVETVLHEIGYRVVPLAQGAKAQVKVEAYGSALSANYDGGIVPTVLFTGADVNGTVNVTIAGGGSVRSQFYGSLSPSERGSPDQNEPGKAPFAAAPTTLQENLLAG
ncbi:MAG TPA: hypothetical protein VLJ39_08410, partial [Tepidisphaeraceae bacterium]|nr:hypothetical protein [Tepidisphaeraceae bacterium]